MADETYLFIDGKYLREIHGQIIKYLFDEIAGIDLTQLKTQAQAQRVFFYDCENDIKGERESEVDFQARKSKQDAYFQTIQALPGFHLRLGTLTGKRPRLRQKEVDVQLAVDMLTHGFNRNMNKAVLLAGDLDFRPIVEALVRNGVFVEVWYERASAAKDLFWAADFGRELSKQDIYALTDPKFTAANPLPRASSVRPDSNTVSYRNARPGKTNGKKILLIQDHSSKLFVEEWGGAPLLVEHRDPKLLEKFFTLFYAPIDW
jgi:uncharacterized LabA/DUF88 family protein